MSHDITLPIDDGYMNVRVGAIIIKDNRVLMVSNGQSDYLYSVGGRIKFGESAEEAVRREVFEETGVAMEIDRLGFIHENFFHDDYIPSRVGKLIYEISFFFYMKVPENFEPVSSDFDENGSREILVWVPFDTDKKLFPDFFRTELAHPENGVKHMVTDNRK